MNFNKIIIGTANFGNSYGYRKNKIGLVEVIDIIKTANINNINLFDSAENYGPSLEIIKKHVEKKKIITKKKIDPTNDLVRDVVRNWDYYFYATLIHNPEIIESKSYIKSLIDEIKTKNQKTKIGISIYELHQFETALECGFDIIQIPFNLLDNRFIQYENESIEIHARSIFLQGLLTTSDYTKIETKCPKLIPIRREIDAISSSLNCTNYDLCMSVALNQKNIDKIILGISKHSQLLMLINNLKQKKILLDSMIFCDDDEILNPRNWNE